MKAILPLLLILISFHTPAGYAQLTFEPGTTETDRNRFNELVEKCEGELASFREMMDAIRRSNRPVRVLPGRNNSLIDAYGSWEVDLDDLEKFANPRFDRETRRWVFPAGTDRDASTLCERLTHVLWERFLSNYQRGPLWDRYLPSHESANDREGAVRREYGQDGSPIDHNHDQSGGAITVYRNGGFIIERWTFPGGQITGVTTERVNVICLSDCDLPRGSFRLRDGAADCDACRTRLRDRCTTAGGTLSPNFICGGR